MAQGVAGMGWQVRRSSARWGRPLLASMVALSLSGCGAYLHDTRLATSTSELKATYEKLEAPAMMAELQQREEAFATAETRALVEQGVASRNEILVNVIRTPPLRERRPDALGTGTDLLRGDVDRKLTRVFGAGSFDATTMQLMFNAPKQIREWSDDRETVARRLAEEVTGFLVARDAYNKSLPVGAPRDERKTDCPSVLARPAEEEPTTALERRYSFVFTTCEDLAEIDAGLALVNHNVLARATSTSQLGAAYQELTRLKGSRAAGQAQAKDLKALLQTIEKKSKIETSADKLEAEIKSFHEKLAKAEPIAREAGLEGLSTFIEDLLAAELKPEEGAAPTPTTVKGAVALQVLRAIAQADDAFASQPRLARTNELLLATARTRHELRMAQLDIARDEALLQNLEAQIGLMLIQAAHLSEARDFLSDVRADDIATARAGNNNRSRTDSSQALASYLSAWNQGEIPLRVLRFRTLQIKRTAALERARLAEADYRASLKPVFDELAAYGEGGIKPETIAEFLGHLGVAGSILGN